jgi:hypothetical protein
VRSDRADVVIRWNALHPGLGVSDRNATNFVVSSDFNRINTLQRSLRAWLR